MRHALGIGLVPVHDNDLVSFIEFVGHLLAERLNARLDKGLFSINIQSAITLLRTCRDLTNAAIEGIETLKIIRSEVSALFSNLALQVSPAFSIKLEKVAASIPVNSGHFAVDI